MDPPPITIRSATPSDASGIASVHVASWRETYCGMLPAEMLAERGVPERTAHWSDLLRSFARDGPDRAFVAEAPGGIVGFASVGQQRSEELRRDGFDGEITAIYVLARAQRRGVGRALMRRGADHLFDMGHDAASLWVLKANVGARRFYEALGGRPGRAREDVRPEAVLREIAYGWPRLSRLADERLPGHTQ